MKKMLRTVLLAAPLLTLSSMSFAAEAAPQEPMLLSSAQMDGVTAGTGSQNRNYLQPILAIFKNADVSQINISPVIIIQIGNNNYASVISGNFTTIYQ